MIRILKDGEMRDTTAITPVHEAMLLIYVAMDWTQRVRAVRNALRGGWGADVDGSKGRLVIIAVTRATRWALAWRILLFGQVVMYVREGQIEHCPERCYLVTGLPIGDPVAW